MTPPLNPQEWFGQIDIYLFGQLLKGRCDPRMRVLDAGSDVVISSAVLHFARDEEHWPGMVRGMWRVLKPGGELMEPLQSVVVRDLSSMSTWCLRKSWPPGVNPYTSPRQRAGAHITAARLGDRKGFELV